MVRSGSGDTAGTAGEVRGRIRDSAEGNAVPARFPADAEIAEETERAKAGRSGCDQGGGDVADDWGQREAAGSDASFTAGSGGADGRDRIARAAAGAAGRKCVGVCTGCVGDGPGTSTLEGFQGAVPRAPDYGQDEGIWSDRESDRTFPVSGVAQHGVCGDKEGCSVPAVPGGASGRFPEGSAGVGCGGLQRYVATQRGDFPASG